MVTTSLLAGLPLVAAVLVGCTLLSWPLGAWLRAAMDPTAAGGVVATCDGWFRRVGGRATVGAHGWRGYCAQLLVFNAVMFGLGVALLTAQPVLPLDPDGKGALEASLVFHTVSSFVTNTNQQHYAGEVAMSHGTQLCALMWQQFVSAATGLAALAALARGLTGRPLGNFLVDVQRAVFLVLVPLAVPVACLLALGGVPMTFDGAVAAHTMEGAVQTIARGPVAAFVAIKQLGTNGGGFFGANSAHPFENPTFATNMVATMALLVLPMASVWMFGRIVGHRRHAVVLFAAMCVLLLAKLGVALVTEAAPAPAFAGLAVAADVGNLEGKELRFGAGAAPLWAVLTTCTSNGSVNCMHGSLNPLTVLVPLVGMWLNETFGGLGVGMINLFVYLVLAVFVAGMMVGRTPEYLTRRVEVHEVKLAVLAMFAHALCILGGTALFAATSWGHGTTTDTGPHGFTEILYEFSSAAANNGSGCEGLGDATVPWNVATGIVMLLARYVPIVLPLAIAGSLARKRSTAASAGTLAVDTPTFAVMVLATIVFLGALTFLPAAVLGPVAEHLQSVR